MMPSEHVYRPNGKVRLIDFEKAERIKPTYRSWPIHDDEDEANATANWQKSFSSRVARRVCLIWADDKKHPWYEVEHFHFGEIFIYEPERFYFCSMARFVGDPTYSEFLFFELTYPEIWDWFEAEGIEMPSFMQRFPSCFSFPLPTEANMDSTIPDHGISLSELSRRNQGEAKRLIPDLAQLDRITACLADFLNTHNQYSIFLDETIDVGSMSANHSVLEKLARLEEALNPLRFPWGSDKKSSMFIAHWPGPVMVAYPKLISIVDNIIERWDVPEICDDRIVTCGKYGIINTDENGVVTETLIDRPKRPYSLSHEDRTKLIWCLEALHSSIKSVIERMGSQRSVSVPPASQRSFDQDQAKLENPKAPQPLVILGSIGKKPIVRGLEKSRLTTPRYNTVKALIDAGERGLTKDELVNKSGHTDAVGIIKRLRKSDSHWASVIQMGEIPGGRYRILT